MPMTSRQRIHLALSHREADRVPLDLGGTVLTSIHRQSYHRLRQHMALPPSPDVPLMDLYQQIVVVEDDLLQAWGADVRFVGPGLPEPPRVEQCDDATQITDEWGISWRMPTDRGLYYDMARHPLAGATAAEEIARHTWPDPLHPARFAEMRARARHAVEQEGRAVVLGGFCSGVVEMTAWLRGYDRFYPDCIQNTALLGRLMDRIVELKAAYWERALDEVGPHVDVVQEADDLAGQFRMLISPATYRTLCKPRHRELLEFIRSRTSAKVFFHSCGAIRPIIPDLIEMGVDILNPIQVSATGMDPAELKREFGADLVFWGGGVDTQQILGSGTEQQVRDEVRRRIADLAPNGGFVFATVHNIQSNVPPQNLVAMWEAFQELGVYPQ